MTRKIISLSVFQFSETYHFNRARRVYVYVFNKYMNIVVAFCVNNIIFLVLRLFNSVSKANIIYFYYPVTPGTYMCHLMSMVCIITRIYFYYQTVFFHTLEWWQQR